MRLKSIYCNCVILSVVVVASIVGCSNDKTVPPAANRWFDAGAFPAQPFHRVLLVTIDSALPLTTITDSGSFINTDLLSYVGNSGYSIVDTNGFIKPSRVDKYELDSSMVIQLLSLLKQEPCENDIVTKDCAPVFQHVLMFYDVENRLIAQAHLDAACGMGLFRPDDKGMMCNFDSQANFPALTSLIQRIKGARNLVPEPVPIVPHDSAG